jgi:hypothetical protein
VHRLKPLHNVAEFVETAPLSRIDCERAPAALAVKNAE